MRLPWTCRRTAWTLPSPSSSSPRPRLAAIAASLLPQPVADRQRIGLHFLALRVHLLLEEQLGTESGHVPQPAGAERGEGQPEVDPSREAGHGVEPAVGGSFLAAAEQLQEGPGAPAGGAEGAAGPDSRERHAEPAQVAGEREPVRREVARHDPEGFGADSPIEKPADAPRDLPGLGLHARSLEALDPRRRDVGQGGGGGLVHGTPRATAARRGAR